MGSDKINLAFSSIGTADWHAGTVLVRSMLQSLRKHSPERFRLWWLYEGDSTPLDADIGADGILNYTPLRGQGVNRLTKRLCGYDFLKAEFLKRAGVHAVAFGIEPYRFGVPSLQYIPDLQHFRLPHLFSDGERAFRARNVRRLAARASRILVTSQSTRDDVANFLSPHENKVELVRPVFDIPVETYRTEHDHFRKRFSLPKRFFFLPSQFWKHKNHEGIFRAFKVLNDRGINAQLVCTGHTHDHRHPRHFSELLRLCSELGLREQIHILGFVSQTDLLGLMRESLCVINPSIFEGYALSVEQARSLGKQLLLSDIPAHREHEAPACTYFSPVDEEDLAEKLTHLWEDCVDGPDFVLESEAQRNQPSRMAISCFHFQTIVEDLLA